jgi:Domain of unknown function (DUF3291)
MPRFSIGQFTVTAATLFTVIFLLLFISYCDVSYFYQYKLNNKMEFYLAQINIAKMLGPIDSGVMADFVANLDNINQLAEESNGFIWRLKDDTNNATSIKIFDDDFLIVNMSVWKNMESLFEFVYKSNHVEIFKRRKEWFEKMNEMHMALWFVPAAHQPDAAEATERLQYLRNNGETPYSFSFKKRFTAEDAGNFSL